MKHPQTRGDRLFALTVAKRAAKAKLLRSMGYAPTPRQVGIQASQHNTCGCWMCTHKEDRPVKYKGNCHPMWQHWNRWGEL